jgi:hypothetical protein
VLPYSTSSSAPASWNRAKAARRPRTQRGGGPDPFAGQGRGYLGELIAGADRVRRAPHSRELRMRPQLVEVAGVPPVDLRQLLSAGYSGRTIFFTASWTASGGRTRRENLVLRLQAGDHQLFVTPDAPRQAEVMKRVRGPNTVGCAELAQTRVNTPPVVRAATAVVPSGTTCRWPRCSTRRRVPVHPRSTSAGA